MDVIQLTQLSTKQLAAMLALRVKMEKLQSQFDAVLVACVPKTNGHAKVKIKARGHGMTEKIKARLARRMRKRWREAKANGRTRLAKAVQQSK